MGGINSGRRPTYDGKPVVEESVALNITLLLREGILVNGTQGALQWEDYFGWSEHSLYYNMRGDVLYISYTIRGRHVTQSIKVERIPLRWNNGTYRLRFRCPSCSRGAYILYATVGQAEMRCRKCSNLSYQSQTMHHDNLTYMYWRGLRMERMHHNAWKKWERKKEARRVRRPLPPSA